MVQPPEWPDKIMAAAMLVILSGSAALVHAALLLLGASFNPELPAILTSMAPWWLALSGAATMGVGIAAYIHQSWLLTLAGIVVGVLSVGLFGIASIVAMTALLPWARSFMEGEETKLDRHRMRGHEWPDKAIMASVLLAAAGTVAAFQGVMLITGVMAPLASGPAWAWGLWSLATGLVALFGARRVFHLQGERWGWYAVLAAVGSAGFVLVSPILAVVAVVYLVLANREAEFILNRDGQTTARH